MNIKMKITKSVNANGLNSPVGSIVTMDIEEYLKCVVPNEMSNYYPSAALQAQAVAARTFAMYRVARSPRSSSFDIYDSTKDQSYEYGTEGSKANAAIAATAGKVLTSNGKVFKNFFHASSGGRTLSAASVFGNYPCQPEQDDPWTRSSGYGISGHRVGMSQRGAQWAGDNGKTYLEILAFYYPGSQLESNYGNGGDSTTNPTPIGNWGTGTVTGGKLYCRKQPQAGYDYWGRFDDGAVIPIRALSGNTAWYGTYWAGNQSNVGYVMSQYISNPTFSGSGSSSDYASWQDKYGNNTFVNSSSYSGNVYRFQVDLNKWLSVNGYSKIDEEGKWGSKSAAATKTFQQAFSDLDNDGKAGPKTKEKLFNLYG